MRTRPSNTTRRARPPRPIALVRAESSTCWSSSSPIRAEHVCEALGFVALVAQIADSPLQGSPRATVRHPSRVVPTERAHRARRRDASLSQSAFAAYRRAGKVKPDGACILYGARYAYDMAVRTTILLDETSRKAAKTLAARLDVSPSEAIRRALVYYRDDVIGVPPEDRRRRLASLDRLCGLFEGHDAAAEVRRLKAEDRHW